MQSDPLRDPLLTAEEWIIQGRRVTLVTVIATWGSAPRRSGSLMAVREDGEFVGSVSAGCIEGAVIEAARIALTDGRSKRLAYGVSDETAWAAGLMCGGRIELLVEPLLGETAHRSVTAWNALRRDGRTVVRAVDLMSGNGRVIDPERETDALAALAKDAARHERSGEISCDGNVWFLTVANPPVDLVIAGAVHIAQALARIAAPLGYRLRIIDPRTGFATAERFPGLFLNHGYPDEVLALAPLHGRSAVVVLAHDPKIDDPALIAALRSPAFYIGALGSQKTQAARRERLRAQGFGDGDLARLHGPVGLPIGSKTPEEIAVSIIADIIKTLHQA
jgi:xanthine dehydrogenase accessory factor